MSGSTSEVNLKIVKFCVGQVFAIVLQVFARVGTFRDYATLTTHRERAWFSARTVFRHRGKGQAANVVK